uniref:Alpha carbonic anhydrase 7-like n=1 Tax=Tanacetum cinerariifolium TaxID=118510 RepID=A0A699GX92_TANCI|nr:alpha carbonic anhydrase 7-like [Tanacetum cinerariifolium]
MHISGNSGNLRVDGDGVIRTLHICETVHDEADVNARPVHVMNDRCLKLYRPDVVEKSLSIINMYPM